MKTFFRFSCAFMFLAACAQAADLQPAYPTKPVRLVLPFPPGGSTDAMARVTAQKLTDALGKQIVVDNRGGGAGGISGTDLVAKAAPDGYVLLFTISISHTSAPSLYGKLPYDPVRDFTPITMVAFAPLIMVVHPGVAATSVKELVALAKAKPGQLNYASGGNGGSGHLAAELFKSLAGISMVHIPYKGGGPALIGAVGGEVQMLMLSVVAALPPVKSGRLRALAVTSSSRSPELPDVPTIAESGVPGYEVVVWYGLFGPRGLPKGIVDFLHREVVGILHAREVLDRLAADGAQPLGNKPEEFAVINKAEVEKWTKVVREAGIKAN